MSAVELSPPAATAPQNEPVQPAWLATIHERLKERDRREKGALADLIETNSQLQSQLTLLNERNTELQEALTRVTAQTSNLSGEEREEYTRWRKERTQLYRQQGQNAQRLLELNDTLRDKERELKSKQDTILELTNQLRATATKKDDLVALVQEKDNAFQLLHDEYAALQLEVNALDQRRKELEEENRQLVERWLRKLNDDAENMNKANELYEVIVQEKQRDTTATSTATSPIHLTSPLLDSRMRPGMVRSVIPSNATRTFQAHGSEINDVAWSGDGSMFATASGDRNVRLFDRTGKLNFTLTGCLQTVMCVQFSGGDDLVMATSNDHSIRLWNTNTGRAKLTLTGHIGHVWAARFSADSRQLVSGSHDRTIKVWDTNKGTCSRTIFTYSTVNDLCLTDDFGIISGHMDNSVRLWDANTGDNIKEITGIHAGQITSVSVAPDAYQILTCSRDNTLKLIDVRTYQVLNTFASPEYRIASNSNRACFSSDGQFVVAGAQSGSICLWNTLTAKLEASLPLHSAAVSTVRWSPLGKGVLLSADARGTVAIWE